MKTRIPRLCLFAGSVGAAITLAQTQTATPELTDEAQRFLNAPAWYFNYTVTTKTSQPGYGGNRTLTTERVINGTLQLALRTQGPSLSVVTGEAKLPGLVSQTAAQQAQALAAGGGNLSALSAGLSSVSATQVEQAGAEFDAFFGNYANWILGANIDEEKSDQENERRMQQIIDQGNQAFERYRWSYSGTSHVGGHDRGSASGSGTVQFGGVSTAFEIDGANRKFKLLLPLHFTDSNQSIDALRGQEDLYIGTIHHERREVKTGLHSGEHPLVLRPEYKMIEGQLPGAFGNISGQSLHSILAHDGTTIGSLRVEYFLSPFPPIPVEMIIEPPAEYLRWQPLGNKDEKTAGDTIAIKVVVQKPGGGAPQFKPAKITYYLRNTSREKGICMNWPPNPDSGLPHDLQFEQQENPDLLVLGSDGQVAVNTSPSGLTDTVTVSSFDFGAHGELAATAVLENGQMVRGKVKFTADQEELKLPFRPDRSIIASAFFDHHGLSGVGDDDDTESDPVGDSFTGDGLTLYEEYRGFMVGENWTPGDPKKKEVFVVNELRGLPSAGIGIHLFAGVTKFKVHQLWDNQVNPDGQINHLRTAGPQIVEQHAIRIQAGDLVLLGSNFAQVTGDVGTPGTAKTVSIQPDLGTSFTLMYMASTLAHEMLHACNVYHHGECDTTVWWSYDPGSKQIYESDVTEDTATGALVSAGNRVPITVRTEAGVVVDPTLFFKGTGGPIVLALAHGQHSGDDNCIMRYDNAQAYKSRSDVFGRYLSGREATGYALCTSPAGKGVNDASRTTPQPRYFSAATPRNGGPGVLRPRGDCVHQLRVNDLATEPKR